MKQQNNSNMQSLDLLKDETLTKIYDELSERRDYFCFNLKKEISEAVYHAGINEACCKTACIRAGVFLHPFKDIITDMAAIRALLEFREKPVTVISELPYGK